MSKFQLIVTGIFIACIIAGVIAFATYKGVTGGGAVPAVNIWGTFPATTFNKYISDINQNLASSITVNYTEIKPDQFSSQFVSALARGRGTDVVLIPADMILPHRDKLVVIPYSALSQRQFMNNYVDEAQIYLTTTGTYGVPFTIDPLIMYWNRDLFNAAGIASFPRYWDEFTGLNQKLTLTDTNGNIRKTAIAMGEFSNITNARELFGSLLLQLGNPVTKFDQYGIIVSALSPGVSVDTTPAIQFFTQFVDPSSPNYSWNRGMPNDKTAFLSGIDATYFGFASEISDIRTKNPNLNFDAAPLPQVRTGGVKSTYGKMLGFSIVRSSPNANNDYQVLNMITNPAYLQQLSSTMYLPTVRRDVIALGSNDPYISIFNQAALVSKTWLDADSVQSKTLFASLISNVTSGQKSIRESLQDTGDKFNVMLSDALK